MFKKKNLFEKLLLKYSNRDKYRQYKWEAKNHELEEFTIFLNRADRLNTVEKIKNFCSTNTQLNIKHSGNAGDIIYALATIKRIYELTGTPINLYLKLGAARILPKYLSHPLGSIMLNQKIVDMIAVLINTQPYISQCEVYNGQEIHIDLDVFRTGIIPLDRGNIGRWCGYITGATPLLHQSWLTVKPDALYADKIVIARSGRYRNEAIDYSFLSKYKNLVFVGLATEYDDMRKSVPDLQWVQVDDFLQMAQIIAGCRLFIGNQSFAFSMAEALKVPRILEAYYEITNVIPEGDGAHDFFFQEHLEALVSELS